VWTRSAPIPFDEFVASEEARRESWRRRFVTLDPMAGAEPNRGHRAVAHLVRRGKAGAVITQTIDGLHQASGVPADRVIELHGNATYARCLDCGERYEIEPIRRAFLDHDKLPVCDVCAGIVKSATISFGQAMPADAMARAQEETLACDLFIAMGSSLVVFPAAGFPVLARRKGARLVILNREPTELDPFADLVIHAEIGPTLGAATGVN
jgi:NAD-dependent deacetylase